MRTRLFYNLQDLATEANDIELLTSIVTFMIENYPNVLKVWKESLIIVQMFHLNFLPLNISYIRVSVYIIILPLYILHLSIIYQIPSDIATQIEQYIQKIENGEQVAYYYHYQSKKFHIE